MESLGRTARRRQNRKEFVDYTTVAIGFYAAANGISRSDILFIENKVAYFSHFAADARTDRIYYYLPQRNVFNTDLGYRLYYSGLVKVKDEP